MTVAEMIEWLKTQDQEATVRVLVMERGRGYASDYADERDFDPSLSWPCNLRGNPNWDTDKRGPAPNRFLLGETL